VVQIDVAPGARSDDLKGSGATSKSAADRSRLLVEALGPLRLTIGTDQGSAAAARPIVVPRVMEAIIGYLVAQPHFTASREQLAWQLWGDAGAEQARQNLRQALHRLRRHLQGFGLDALVLRDQTVALNSASVDCSLPLFAMQAESSDVSVLERAVSVYRGPFLDGFQSGRDTFEDWLRAERARYERLAMRAINDLAARHAASGDGVAAVSLLEQLHAMDPFNEDIQRRLLMGIAAVRGRQAALRRGNEIAAMLQRELACEMASETIAVLDRIRTEGVHEPLRPAVAAPAPGLPPSVAVLPFDTTGTPPELAHVADGLAQDMTTGLTRLRWLGVIAPGRGSLAAGTPDVIGVGRSLAAKYLITGSVRTDGRRLRATVNLVDAATARQLFSERFDRPLDDLFAVQDEISSRAVALIEPCIYEVEGRQASSAGEGFADSWGLVMQATSLVQRFERQPNQLAQDMLARALALDPDNARAHAVLAWAKLWASNCRWTRDHQQELEAAIEHAEQGLRHDAGEAWCHMMLGFVRSSARHHDRGLDALDTAVSLNPSSALARMLRGWAMVRAGAFDRAVEETTEALRLRPADQFGTVYLATHGLALLAGRRFEEALPHLRASVIPFTEYMGHYNTLISCCGHLGRVEEARRWLAFRHKALGRPFVLANAAGALKGFAHADTFIEGLRLAGVE
jgi:adenylate cyclase